MSVLCDKEKGKEEIVYTRRVKRKGVVGVKRWKTKTFCRETYVKGVERSGRKCLFC